MSNKMPVIIGVIVLAAIVGLSKGYITLNFFGINSQKQTRPVQIEPSELPVTVPTTIPNSSPRQNPTTITQPVNDLARERKEKEIERIDEQIEQVAKMGLEDVELKKGSIETFKKCDSEWCRDSLRKDIEWIDGLIQDTKDQIETLELQRATIVSGL